MTTRLFLTDANYSAPETEKNTDGTLYGRKLRTQHEPSVTGRTFRSRLKSMKIKGRDRKSDQTIDPKSDCSDQYNILEEKYTSWEELEKDIEIRKAESYGFLSRCSGNDIFSIERRILEACDGGTPLTPKELYNFTITIETLVVCNFLETRLMPGLRETYYTTAIGREYLKSIKKRGYEAYRI